MATTAKLNVVFGADLKDFQKGMAQAQRGLADFGKKMTAVGAGLTKTLTLPIVGFLGASTRAFTKQEDAERKLAAAIGATGGAVDSNMKRFKAFASEMQRLTVVGDETVLSLLQIATAQGLSAESSERAAKNAIALQSAFGVGAESAIRMTAALEQGDATMLRRYIPALRGVEDNAMAVVKAQEILTGAFSIAEAEALTFGGQITQLKNAFGDFMEAIGSVVAEALTPFVTKAKEVVANLQNMDRELLKTYVTFGLLAAAIPVAVVAIGKLMLVISALMTPLALKIAAIVAVGVAINTLAHNAQALSQRFVHYFTIAKNAVIDMTISAINALGRLVSYFDTVLSVAIMSSTSALEGFKSELSDTSEFTPFIGVMDSLGKTFDMVGESVKNFIFGESSGGGGGGISGIKPRIDEATISLQNFERVGARSFETVSVAMAELPESIMQSNIALEAITPVVDNFVNSFGQGMANVVVQGENLVDTLKNIGKLLASAVIQRGLQLLLSGGLASAGEGFFGSGGGLLGSIFGKSGGGRVQAGQPYMTGEIGSELFIPSTNGSIISHRQLQGLGGQAQPVQVNVNVSGKISGRDLVFLVDNNRRTFN